MDPPPPPPTGRFRLRVHVFAPQDLYNLSATPLRQFMIAKTSALPLADLTLQQLCDEVVKRFQAVYPSESLFAIERSQDSYGSDLYLGDRVQDIFEDNEIFRVIKGSSIRASVEPHRERSRSVQPSRSFTEVPAIDRRRRSAPSDLEDIRGGKRRRVSVIDPDDPVRSTERDPIENRSQACREFVANTTVIYDSQETREDRMERLDSNALAKPITSTRTPSPVAPVAGQESGLSNQLYPKVTRTPTLSTKSLRSIENSKDEASTSGSENHLATPRSTAASKKKFHFDDLNDFGRGLSTSTALTTPPSVLQRSNDSSPKTGKKRLTRPTIDKRKIDLNEQSSPNVPQLGDGGEIVESDHERPIAKARSPNVLSEFQNTITQRDTSTIKPRQQSSSMPTNDKKMDSLRQRIQATSRLAASEDLEHHSLVQRDRRQLEQNQEHLSKPTKRTGPILPPSTSRIMEKRQLLAQEKLPQTRLTGEQRITNGVPLKSARAERVAARSESDGDEDNNIELIPTPLSDAEAERNAVAKAKKLSLQPEVDSQRCSWLRSDLNGSRDSEKRGLTGNPVGQSRIRNRPILPDISSFVKTPNIRPIGAHITPMVSHQNASALKISSPLDRRTSSTSFIPRGRPSVLAPADFVSSQAMSISSDRTSSPNIAVEARVSTPSQARPKVSFIDPKSSSRDRSHSAGSSANFRQTTLVPPRLGITDVKSTPRRSTTTATPSSSGTSKTSKGKAKVIESPGKAPSPAIVLSSGDESVLATKVLEYQIDYSHTSSSPGPSYRKSERFFATSKSSTNATKIAEIAESLNHSSQSSPDMRKVKILNSQIKSPAKERGAEGLDSSKTAITKEITLSNKDGEGASSPKYSKSKSISLSPDFVTARVGKAQGAKVPNSPDIHAPSKEGGSDLESESSRSNEDESSDEEESSAEEGSDGDEDEITDSESEAELRPLKNKLGSVDTQAEVDSQLLAPSVQKSAPVHRRTSTQATESGAAHSGKDVEMLKALSAKMPSLRRMNLEAKRTKEADLEAAKLRGLLKAQKLNAESRRAEESVESSEEDSTSDSGSNSSGGESSRHDSTKPPNSHSGRKSRASTSASMGTNGGDLDSEDNEEIRLGLFAKIGGPSQPSSSATSALQTPRKPDRTESAKSSKKSAKPDWAKLAKQFSANRHSNGGRI